MVSNESSAACAGAAGPKVASSRPSTGASVLRGSSPSSPQTSSARSSRGADSGASSAPISTSATRAKVCTSRAKKPQVSRLGERSRQRCSEMRPWVGRMPYSPQWLAGARTEPPVSVPSAKSHRALDTAEAEPHDEPPAMRSGAAPLRGAPKCAFLPFMLKASSSVMTLPTKRAPASSSFCTVGAVCVFTPDSASSSGLPPLVG